MTIKVAAYYRVSTDEQKLGIDAQRDMVRDFCNANNLCVAREFADHGVSGGLELDKRPALLEALDAVSDKSVQAIVVAKRCRLARDGYVAAMVYRLVERHGAKVMCADGVANGDTPEDMLLRGMLDLFAQYERELIRARTRAAMSQKRKRHEHTGGHAPFGFEVVDGKLVKSASEQRAIKIAKLLRGSGMSLRKIGTTLSDQGLTPRSGGAWHASSIKCLLASNGSLSR